MTFWRFNQFLCWRFVWWFMEIVEKIFELVDKKYKDQKDFAKDINISASAVSKWRNRNNKSFLKMLPEIAEALGVTVAELYGESAPAVLTDPMAGFDKNRDYLMLTKDKNGMNATVMVPKGNALPAEAVEVAEAYLALDTAGRNMVRRMLGLSDLQTQKEQTG